MMDEFVTEIAAKWVVGRKKKSWKKGWVKKKWTKQRGITNKMNNNWKPCQDHFYRVNCSIMKVKSTTRQINKQRNYREEEIFCALKSIKNSPGCWRWRGEEEKAFFVCRRPHSCLSPRRLKQRSGSAPGRLGPSPCLCGSLGACHLHPCSPWAPGCASALGILGFPSRRHSPPCIYYKTFTRRVSCLTADVLHSASDSLKWLTSCHSRNQNQLWSLCL